jgi:chemotaxis protein MotB
MAKNIKQPEEEEAPGAPEWMVTFSDCMTLLLTFFVLLLSFSSFDDKEFHKLGASMAGALPSIGLSSSRDREAFLSPDKIKYEQEIDTGSEKPTLNGQYTNNLQESPDLLDFKNRKVFIIASNSIFVGESTIFSPQGKELLTDIAKILKELPNQIVIAEYDRNNFAENPSTGIKRAWSIISFLCNKDIETNRLSTSSASTIPKSNFTEVSPTNQTSKNSRQIEIVILEPSIYN